MIRHCCMALSAALLLAGCQSTQETGQNVRSQWVGKPVSSFFSQYGLARSDAVLQDGSTLYEWSGGEENILVSPGGTRTPPPQKITQNRTVGGYDMDGKYRTRTVRSEISIPQQPVRTEPRYAHLECRANITTDKAGIITSFVIVRDTMGEWNLSSRCAEVFKN